MSEHDPMLNRRKQFIQSWMESSLTPDAMSHFDDLHIDQIDLQWKPRTAWLAGAFEALRLAALIRDEHGWAVEIALAFSLVTDELAIGVDFESPADFQERLDWSPPSLYLFRPDATPWQTDESHKSIVSRFDPRRIGIDEKVKDCLCLEFRQEDPGDLARTVFVVA